ncbi:papain-like cysteine peptidase [Scandinavium sp. H11S7]|uniref:Papain-like cysteine peptidase n=1 Tax=Scandinavium hiltneri TaxID=2926519 RepID=A0ABT2E4Z5_9ENTR|nr:papain-like cysteine peptidase [Scandinavium hiltneri]MCS2162827.1 papain-like cysteine peptidase [Scandinavium hiltneri]
MQSQAIKQQIKNNLRSIKRTFTNINKKWKNRRNFKTDVIWISLGENCLADDILRRHNKKSFSSVFSSGRSNIEYILQMERDNYLNLLKKDNLKHFPDGQHSVVRSTYYNSCIGNYSPRHMLGFEFSHHDPLNVKEDNRAFSRRIARQLKYRGMKNFVFLYHHRITDKSDISLLKSYLNEFLALYNIKKCQCKMILFYQNIIDNKADKFIDFTSYDTGLLEFVCHTHETWGGDNLETFWAKKDDTLFEQMFNIVDKQNNVNLMS